MKKRLVLDTSIFVNPASAHVFGNSPTAALTNFLRRAQDAQGIEFFMPPSVYSELMHFVDEPQIPKPLLLLIEKRPPKKHEIKIPAIFVYNIVESMRDRIDRGLRLAERHVREAVKSAPPPQSGTSAPVREDAEAISRLRESYRRIMREGALDSKADVDLILLAYEVEGTLVSADQGVQVWAENLGVTLLAHDHLVEFLTENGAKTTL